MNTITIILLAVLGVVVLLLIFGFFMRKEYHIHREVIIDAPLSKVFDYLKLLKNQDHFNKWVMVDPNMKKEFTGTDGTVGFIYGWNGNKKAGAGEQEIKSIVEGKRVETEIRFIRPFVSVAYANLITESLSDNQTKVTWTNASRMKYPLNIMLSTIEKMLAKDMDTSLQTLKSILEKK
jgi:uncharacterized protein YndB with AHSA1/START domain